MRSSRNNGVFPTRSRVFCPRRASESSCLLSVSCSDTALFELTGYMMTLGRAMTLVMCSQGEIWHLINPLVYKRARDRGNTGRETIHTAKAYSRAEGTNIMATEVNTRSYDEAVSWFRDHGFDILEAPGTQNRVFLKKYNCSAAMQKTDDDGVKVFAYPGYLISGEISKLVNRGYQQFLKTTKTEV